VELKDISSRLKPDFNAIRLSKKRNFLLLFMSIKKWFPIKILSLIRNPFPFMLFKINKKFPFLESLAALKSGLKGQSHENHV